MSGLLTLKGILQLSPDQLIIKISMNYTADLIININSSTFQVLNTQPKDNPMFYGTAYASGVAKIKSDQNSLSFDISAKTGKSTKTGKTSKLSIPLNKGLSVSEYSYHHF